MSNNRLPYVYSLRKLKTFMQQIVTAPRPDKLNTEQLRLWGFTAGNDSYFAALLEKMGFTDAKRVPTERWERFRTNPDDPTPIEEGIRQAWPSLYGAFGDPRNTKDAPLISNLKAFAPTESEDRVTQSLAVYRSLCEMSKVAVDIAPTPTSADHAGDELTPAVSSDPLDEQTDAKPEATSDLGISRQIVLNVNVQLQLPESSDIAVYDALFASLRNHILDR